MEASSFVLRCVDSIHVWLISLAQRLKQNWEKRKSINFIHKLHCESSVRLSRRKRTQSRPFFVLLLYASYIIQCFFMPSHCSARLQEEIVIRQSRISLLVGVSFLPSRITNLIIFARLLIYSCAYSLLGGGGERSSKQSLISIFVVVSLYSSQQG